MLHFRKQNFFFQQFQLIVKNLNEASAYFRANVCATKDLEGFARQMKEYEKKGDGFTHAIFKALNTTFVTPLEREDILGLTVKLDDILDGLEAAASLIDIYGISECTFTTAFSQNIGHCIDEVTAAIHLLTERKLTQITQYTHSINELENEADELLLVSMKALFTQEKDAIQIIKKKEIYTVLENISDLCEDVADILESIIMRNS